MKGIAKGVLIAILSSIVILLISNLIFFIPWYMSLISEAYNIAQTVSVDNYLKDSYHEDGIDRLEDKPKFDEPEVINTILIEVKHDDGSDAIGDDDPSYYEFNDDWDKPYEQRGNPVNITVSADYLLKVTL